MKTHSTKRIRIGAIAVALAMVLSVAAPGAALAQPADTVGM